MKTKNERGTVLGVASETWLGWADFVYFSALLVVAFATFLSVIAGLIQYKLNSDISIEKEQQLQKYKMEVNRDIAQAQSDAAVANAAAAKSTEEAERARLEQEILKQQLAWRELSRDIVNILLQKLSWTKDYINIIYISQDPESMYFAMQLRRVFTDAQWTIGSAAKILDSKPIFGVFLFGPSTSSVDLIRQAFLAAGLQFSNDTITVGMSFNASLIEGAATIVIGSKQPPF
jgi:hypothetical protein